MDDTVGKGNWRKKSGKKKESAGERVGGWLFELLMIKCGRGFLSKSWRWWTMVRVKGKEERPAGKKRERKKGPWSTEAAGDGLLSDMTDGK